MCSSPTRRRLRRSFSGSGESTEVVAAVSATCLCRQCLTLRAGSAVDRDAVVVQRPAFHHVLKRLRDRLNALATFYGGGPLDLDFRALGDSAEEVQTVDDQTRWVERARFSARRTTAHDLSGFVGTITFRGDLARFLPLLRAGEYIHVGKNAVFGNGWLEIKAFLSGGR